MNGCCPVGFGQARISISSVVPVPVGPRKQLLFLCYQHAQVLLESLFQTGSRCLLVVGLDHLPNPLDVVLPLVARKQADVPRQAGAHDRLLPRLQFFHEQDVWQQEGRKTGRDRKLFECKREIRHTATSS
ncbi:MAG: hypothetical protein V4633_15360 [Pseudomonadota bacterium]